MLFNEDWNAGPNQNPFTSFDWDQWGPNNSGRKVDQHWLQNVFGTPTMVGVIVDSGSYPFGPDQYAEVVHHSGDFAGPVVRGNTAGDGYLFVHTPSGLEISKVTAGANFPLATVAFHPPANALFKLEVIGTTLNGYTDSVLRLSTTDSTYSSGQPGVGSYQTSSSINFWLDAFEASDGSAASLGTTGALVAGVSVLSGLIDTPSALEEQFSPLSGDAPICKFLAVVKQFLWAGYIIDPDGTEHPQQVRCSAINDPGNWPVPGSTAAATAQSILQNIKDSEGGPIQALIGGEALTVFMKRAIYIVQYTGSETVWSFYKVPSIHGLAIKKCAIKAGKMIFFLDQSGFYMLQGEQITPIGLGKVDRFFWSHVNTTLLDLCHAAVDIQNKCVIWMYPDASTGDESGCDKGLIYQWETENWALVDIIGFPEEFLFNGASPGYTLEDLDVFGPIEDVPHSLDSGFWLGGTQILHGFNSTHFAQRYNSTALSAVIETREVELYPMRLSRIRGVRPVVNGGPLMQVLIGHRSLQSDSVSYTSPVLVNTRNGMHDLRVEDRYHRVRMVSVGDFTHLVGYDLDTAQGGKV